MKLLVVGTGRSGTGWCAQVLRSVGVDCGHEGVFGPRQALGERPVEPDWYGLDADSSWLAVPLLPLDARVALVVRHPLHVVASLLHIGFHRHDTNYRRAAEARVGPICTAADLLEFWAVWNRDAAAHAEATFTLSDLTADPSLLTRWAGASKRPTRPDPANVRPEWKTGPRPDVAWSDFDLDLADEVREDWHRYREAA